MLKPDPRIFDLLLQRARLRPQEAAHVGDDPVADVEGARRAGLLPVWVNRAGFPWTLDSTAPDVTIASLGELPEALHRAPR